MTTILTEEEYKSTMIRILVLAMAFIIISCDSTRKEVLLRKDIDDKGSARFYKDFNIFSRQGVDEIKEDTLRRPFLKVRMNADSSILLTVFKTDLERQVIIPKGDSLRYYFHDVSDGPRHHYYKIFKDSMVVYGYESKIDEVQHWPEDSISLFYLIPSEVKILTQDTLYVFFRSCFNDRTRDDEESEVKIPKRDFLKYAVMPFSKAVDLHCKDCLIHYFDSTGTIRHYYRSSEVNEYPGKKNPGNGLFGYRKEFKYWRDYYIVF
jgi:hypothetical protein